MKLVLYPLLLLFFAVVSVFSKQPDKKFRIEKLNYVWSKVRTDDLDEIHLKKLRTELDKFDVLYMSEKHDGEHQKRKSATLSEIDEKLERLLERYDLDETLRAFRMKYKYEKSKIYGEEKKENTVNLDTIFNDKRVQRLWNAAKDDRDLLADELDGFYERLKVLDSKIESYNELQASHKEERSNHLEEDEEHDKNAIALKRWNKEIESEIEGLKEVITGAQENPFVELKARKLWAKVLGNRQLSAEKLGHFKADVRAYEKLLMKVAHHRKILDDAKQLLYSQYKDKADQFHDDQVVELEEEQSKLERKLKKLETYIQEDLAKERQRHEEL